MTIHRKTGSGSMKGVIAASLAAAIGLALTSAPAFADPHWDHDGWHHHERWEHHHWDHRDDDDGGYAYGYAPLPPAYYAPPPAYYAPPPAYYAPPPVYYGPPSFSFGVNIPLNH